MTPHAGMLEPPSAGLWRVGLATAPYMTKPVEQVAASGNRFDSVCGDYAVLYFATQREACFGETIAHRRPSLALQALVGEEWRELGFKISGSLPAAWRSKRLLLRARVAGPFFDVEDDASRVFLETQPTLAEKLSGFGLSHLDMAALIGPDRRVTRQISQWVHDCREPDGSPRYSGVRYLSRHDVSWECWAVFDRTLIVELERDAIRADDSSLKTVAARWKIAIEPDDAALA